jgi:hypothetical protein
LGHILQILPDNLNHGQTDMEWFFVSIRDRLKWLSQMGHERCLLLKRRYDGQLCPFTSTVRHSSQQHVQDTICYGTNFINPNVNLAATPGFNPASATSIALPDGLGGYYHSIEVTASLLSAGPSPIETKDVGWKRDQVPTSWTLWEPILEKGDIIVRRNNQRYMITSVDPKRWRHFVTHQVFTMTELEKNHPIFSLKLEGV